MFVHLSYDNTYVSVAAIKLHWAHATFHYGIIVIDCCVYVSECETDRSGLDNSLKHMLIDVFKIV